MVLSIKNIVKKLPTKVKLYQRGYTLHNKTWSIYTIGGHWVEGVTLSYKAKKRGVPSTLQDVVRVDDQPLKDPLSRWLLMGEW